MESPIELTAEPMTPEELIKYREIQKTKWWQKSQQQVADQMKENLKEITN